MVYSYFREVLQAIAHTLDGRAIGPLAGKRGSVGAAGDGGSAFRPRRPDGAGESGTAEASVVVRAEPAVESGDRGAGDRAVPSIGQVRVVNVCRLLTEDSVDRRILVILRVKEVLFDEYARRSELKDVSPDAVVRSVR
jgi:hypothetical protein